MLFWEHIDCRPLFSSSSRSVYMHISNLECPIAHNDARETAQGRLPWFDNGMNNKNGNLGTSAYWKRDTQPKMTHAKDIKWLRYFQYLSYLGGVVMDSLSLLFIRWPTFTWLAFARNFVVSLVNKTIDSHLFTTCSHFCTSLTQAHISRNIDSFCDL